MLPEWMACNKHRQGTPRMETKPVPMLNPPIDNEAQWEQFERFKEKSFVRFETLTALTFDRETGGCAIPGKVRMDGEISERWAALCTQFCEKHDTQKAEELLREVGPLLRKAAGGLELKKLKNKDPDN
jgi:hypothetical protein